MRGIAIAILLCITLAGCAAGPSAVYVGRPGVAPANLAIGPSTSHTFLSEAFAYRSAWPSVSVGYRFDDVSTYTELIFDDESFYDTGYGSGFTREAVSFRTGVLVR